MSMKSAIFALVLQILAVPIVFAQTAPTKTPAAPPQRPAQTLPLDQWRAMPNCAYGKQSVSFASAVIDGRMAYQRQDVMNNHDWFQKIRSGEQGCPKPKLGQDASVYKNCVQALYSSNQRVRQDPDQALDTWLKARCPHYVSTPHPYTQPSTITAK
jgi:hypothetical protein